MFYRKGTISVPGAPGEAELTLYAPDLEQDNFRSESLRPALVICPGGAYCYTSDREAEPVALAFLAKGYNVYVLRYHCAPEARWPIPQLELAAAVHTVRQEAAALRTDPASVYVMGFSAGGHLAASLGILWAEADWADVLGLRKEDIRPDGMVLAYPVITSGEKAHAGSFDALVGKNNPELRESLSLEKRVTEKAVPAFLWHTREDDAVPVENSLWLAAALSACGVGFELHVYPHGGHGLSLADERTAVDPAQIVPAIQGWTELADRWMREAK